MICEIIVSKAVCGIFLIFCRLSFTNNYLAKNNFSELKNQRKTNISRPIYFLKNSAHRFVCFICTNKLEELFFRKYCFQGLGAFFMTAKPLIYVSFFSSKNLFHTFFQGWLFNFSIILKTRFENLFRKTVKKWWFCSFK